MKVGGCAVRDDMLGIQVQKALGEEINKMMQEMDPKWTRDQGVDSSAVDVYCTEEKHRSFLCSFWSFLSVRYLSRIPAAILERWSIWNWVVRKFFTAKLEGWISSVWVEYSCLDAINKCWSGAKGSIFCCFWEQGCGSYLSGVTMLKTLLPWLDRMPICTHRGESEEKGPQTVPSYGYWVSTIERGDFGISIAHSDHKRDGLFWIREKFFAP